MLYYLDFSFQEKPKSPDMHISKWFDIKMDGSTKAIPKEVRQEGIKYWSNHLVVFFLNGSFSYLTVVSHLKRTWKLSGEVDIKSNNEKFFFNFSN